MGPSGGISQDPFLLNTLGKLDATLVRYALNKYFVQKNGWYVKGLDATWFHENSSDSTMLKGRTPAYIQSLFEEHVHGRGLGPHELAVFVATMADLIHAEATGMLELIHRVKGLPTGGLVPMPSRKPIQRSSHFSCRICSLGRTGMSLRAFPTSSGLEKDCMSSTPTFKIP